MSNLSLSDLPVWLLIMVFVLVYRMKALGSLIGKVPSNPLWAELLAARQRHVKARSASKSNLAAVAAGGEEESSTTATTMTGEQIKSPPPPAVPEK